MPSPIIATIDFEGSALRGYPIEVGVALWHRGADQIRVWSTLIRPIAPWRQHPARWWDPQSEKIQGIAAGDLDAGLHSGEVMIRLNAIVSGTSAFCHGGTFDQCFLTRLSDAAGVAPSFVLGTPVHSASMPASTISGACASPTFRPRDKMRSSIEQAPMRFGSCEPPRSRRTEHPLS